MDACICDLKMPGSSAHLLSHRLVKPPPPCRRRALAHERAHDSILALVVLLSLLNGAFLHGADAKAPCTIISEALASNGGQVIVAMAQEPHHAYLGRRKGCIADPRTEANTSAIDVRVSHPDGRWDGPGGRRSGPANRPEPRAIQAAAAAAIGVFVQ